MESGFKSIKSTISDIYAKFEDLTKDCKKSSASTSGRWIAFFCKKKLKKGYIYDIIYSVKQYKSR